MSIARSMVLVVPLFFLACGSEEQDRPRPRQRPTPTKVNKQAKAPLDGGSDASRVTDAGDAGELEPLKGTDRSLLKKQLEARRLVAQARYLSETKQPEAAVKAATEALDLDPDNGWTHAEIARICFSSGDQECATSEAQAAIKAGSKNAALLAAAHRLQGEIHEAAGDNARAISAYENSLKISPRTELLSKLEQLRVESNPLPPSSNKIVCPLSGAKNQQAVATAENSPEGHGRAICPLHREPFVERDADGIPIETYVMAAITQHEATNDLLRGYAGIGGQGTLSLLLVRVSRDQAKVITLDPGTEPERENEIIRELSAEVRRVTLGPSRPGIAVEVVSHGWWDVTEESTPYEFERHELYLAGRQLNKYGRLVNQVTLERGHKGVEDCFHERSSQQIHRGGFIWLEDLDLSGVPEICRESWSIDQSTPSWVGRKQETVRNSAICRQWIASTLHDSKSPVPSLTLDNFDQERSVGYVLEVSRVPAQIRAFVKNHLENDVFITARGLELTKSGMRAIAIVVNENHVKALAVSAADSVNILDLGKIGRWREIWGTIDASDPELISVEVQAHGDDLGGATARRWLHLISAGPGEPPRLALTEDIRTEDALSNEPCPSVVQARYNLETKEGGIFLSMERYKLTGPGTSATEQWSKSSCKQFQRWVQNGESSQTTPDAGVPLSNEDICPISREHVEDLRYTQGADGRFVRTNL